MAARDVPADATNIGALPAELQSMDPALSVVPPQTDLSREARGAPGGAQGTAGALGGDSYLAKLMQLDISHQEMDRIVEELEKVYEITPVEWLACEGVGQMVGRDLGYEDDDEFEEALKGSFADFLRLLPGFEVRATPGSKPGEGKNEFKILPPPPANTLVPKKMVLNVKSSQDLWRVCMKAADATIEIPELEFQIGSDQRRKIDSIYNHIGAAIFNLGSHVREAGSSMNEDTKNKIVDTIHLLNLLLDVPRPWTFIVHDPSGMSEIKPDAGVTMKRTEVGAPLEALAEDDEDDMD
mmetsp:Transcript_12295/g.37878  ORF Transcript_12295/g.37878 Transcript_12295/m.37878 type:complete len:296 (-) Transcript_12295:61-948(-)